MALYSTRTIIILQTHLGKRGHQCAHVICEGDPQLHVGKHIGERVRIGEQRGFAKVARRLVLPVAMVEDRDATHRLSTGGSSMRVNRESLRTDDWVRDESVNSLLRDD